MDLYESVFNEKCLELQKEMNKDLNCCGECGWEREEDKLNASVKRFHLPSNHESCSVCKIGVGQWEENIHILGWLSGDIIGRHIYQWAKNLKDLYPNACRHGVFKLCRVQTGLMKMGGTKISKYWRYLTYWELGYGYQGYKKMVDMIPDSESWLRTPVKLGGPLGEQEYLRLLGIEVRKLMKEEWHLPKHYPDISTWLERGAWMRGHSGSGPASEVKIDGKVKRTRRMKGVEASIYDDTSIGMMLFVPVKETFDIIQKSEGGKIRPVAKTGNRINRMMDYLSELWETGMYGSRISTLFAGSVGNEEIDLELLELTRDKSWYKVPLDQGSFDWHQSVASIRTVLENVWDIILESCGWDEEVVRVWEALHESLFVLGAKVRVGKEKTFDWTNGLPSGWRWTAILDTFLNVCSFRVISKIASERINTQIITKGFHAQGDDVIFGVRTVKEAAVLIDTYKKIGYEVHALKTYISKERGEFLRRSYEDVGITGYIARTMLSIRYRNPILQLPVNKVERIYSRLVLWHLCMLRGCHPERCGQAYIFDCEQAGVSSRDGADFALTPNCLGGGGLDEDSQLGLVVKQFSTGNWCTIQTTRYLKDLEPKLGKWEGRLAGLGVNLRGNKKRDFLRAISQSWGIREAEVYGKVSVEFVPQQKIEGRIITIGEPVPKLEKEWDLDRVPALVRGIYQRQLVEDGLEKTVLKEEVHGVIDRCKDRMSRKVYHSWLCGDIKVPSPLTDNIGVKYGAYVKDRMHYLLRIALGYKNIGFSRLEEYLLWIENQMIKRLKDYYCGNLMGV